MSEARLARFRGPAWWQQGRAGQGTLEVLDDLGGVGRRRCDGLRLLAGHREQGHRAPLTATQARGPQPGRAAVKRGFACGADQLLQLGAEALGPRQAAGHVVAHAGDDRGPRHRRQHLVERGHAVRIGRRHGQAPARVLRAPAG